MSSNQQSRGLPGFLRRTFRSSDSSVSAINNLPEEDHDSDSRKEAAEVGVDSVKGPRSDSRVQNFAAGSSSINYLPASNELGGNEKNKAMSITEKAVLATTPTSASSTGSRKHLRAIAFPPLPHEKDAHDDNDDEEEKYGDGDTTTTYSSSHKTSSVKPTATTNATSQILESTNQSTTHPAPKSYKEIQFETILGSTIIPIRELRKLAWNGIPPHHRPTIWKVLLGYLPANTSRHATTLARRRREYKDAMKQHYDIPDDSRTNSEQETLRQVLVDVPRTMPEVALFHNDRVRRCLSRLLYIWAMRHPASSYVQGINDLATPLIAVFMSEYFGGKDCLDGEVMGDVSDQMLEEIEADTYWCLTNLLAGIQDHYTSDQPGMQRMVMHLEELVNRIDADLANHLKHTGIEFIQFAFKWMNCLLLREFRLSCVMRLWDTYLSEGDGGFEDFHVYVCASFLVHFSNDLQQMGFDELFQFMQVSDSSAIACTIACL
jgi:hypothetical protein